MLLGTIGTSWLENILAGKGIARVEYGNKGQGIVKANYGSKAF